MEETLGGNKTENKDGKHGGELRGTQRRTTRAGNKERKQGMQLGWEPRDGSNDVCKQGGGEGNKEGRKVRKQGREPMKGNKKGSKGEH